MSVAIPTRGQCVPVYPKEREGPGLADHRQARTVVRPHEFTNWACEDLLLRD